MGRHLSFVIAEPQGGPIRHSQRETVALRHCPMELILHTLLVMLKELSWRFEVHSLDATPTRRTKRLWIQMRDSQVSTVPVPSESLLDDMEQLPAPLEEFDLPAEDSGGNSDLEAIPSPHEQSDDDTESVEWSLQGDSEDTVSLPEVVVDVRPPLHGPGGCGCHLPSTCSSDEERPMFPPRPFQECVESCHGGGFQIRSDETGEGMESVLVVAPDPFAPPSRRSPHFTGQVDCSRLWLMAHHCSEGPSLPSTPRW